MATSSQDLKLQPTTDTSVAQPQDQETSLSTDTSMAQSQDQEMSPTTDTSMDQSQEHEPMLMRRGERTNQSFVTRSRSKSEL